MILANLQVNIGVTGAGQVVASLGQINQAITQTIRTTSGGAGNAIRSFIHSFDELRQIGQLAGQALNAITGVGIAAEYEGIRMQIETVTGSAQEAARALALFRDIGLGTKFEVSEVARFGQQFLNLGDSVDMAGKHMAATLDLAAAGGLQRQDFQRFMTNLSQIRSGGIRGVVDMRQMLSAAPGMGRILGQTMGLGRNATAEDMMGAYRKLGASGFIDLLMKASQQPGVAGAAERLTPFEAFENMLEALRVVMEPTGQIFLAVLSPLGAMITNMARLLGIINEWSKGTLGLGVLIAGIVRGWVYFVGVGVFVREEITKLSTALQHLAMSARMASGSAALAGAAGKAGGIGGFFKGKGGIIGMIAGIAATAVGSKIGGRWGEVLGNAGAGAGLGAMFGPWGALIGGALGGLGTLGYQQFFQKKDQGGATDPLTTALKENTEATKAQTQAIGGGQRFRHAVGQIEMEYALAAMMRI